MLCTSCHNKPHCLAAQLAEGDAALAQMLEQLKRCSLKSPRRDLGQLLKTAQPQALWKRLGLRSR